MALLCLENFTEPTTVNIITRLAGNTASAPNINNWNAEFQQLGFGDPEKAVFMFYGNGGNGFDVAWHGIVKRDGRGWMVGRRTSASTGCCFCITNTLVADKYAKAGTKLIFGFRVAGTTTPDGTYDFIQAGTSRGSSTTVVTHITPTDAYYEISVTYLTATSFKIQYYRNKVLLRTDTYSDTWYVAVYPCLLNSMSYSASVSINVYAESVKAFPAITDLYLVLDGADDDPSTHTGFIGPIKIYRQPVTAVNAQGQWGRTDATGLDIVTPTNDPDQLANYLEVEKPIYRSTGIITSSSALLGWTTDKNNVPIMNATTTEATNVDLVVTDAGGAPAEIVFEPLDEDLKVVAQQITVRGKQLASQAGRLVVSATDAASNTLLERVADDLPFAPHKTGVLKMEVMTKKPDGSALTAQWLNEMKLTVNSEVIEIVE